MPAGLHFAVMGIAHKNNIFLFLYRRLSCFFFPIGTAVMSLRRSRRLLLCLFMTAVLLFFCLRFRRNACRLHGCIFHYAFFSFAFTKMFLYHHCRIIFHRTLGRFCFHPLVLEKGKNIFAVYIQLFCKFKYLRFCHAVTSVYLASSKCPIRLLANPSSVIARDALISFPIAWPSPSLVS